MYFKKGKKYRAQRQIGQMRLIGQGKKGWVMDFKRMVGNSQIDDREKTFSKQILARPPRNKGIQREV